MEYVKYLTIEPTIELKLPYFREKLRLDFTDTYVYNPDYYPTINDVLESLYDSLLGELQYSPTQSQKTFQRGNFNISAAIRELHKNSKLNLKTGKSKDESKYTHVCAKAVRMAMEAGGLNTDGRPNYGGRYGSFLLSTGWKVLPKGSTPEAGDIAVTLPHGNHKSGHIAMFDGSNWYSDAKQRSMYVYSTANDNNTRIYRYIG